MPRYVIIFEADDGPVPAAIRARRLLKFALRSLEMQCISIVEEPTEKPFASKGEPDRLEAASINAGRTGEA